MKRGARVGGKRAATVSGAILIAWALFWGSAYTDAPELLIELPGLTQGEAESYWIAPYALATDWRVGGTGVTTVRWFDGQGQVVQELAGAGLMARSDFVSERKGQETIIHDVNGAWKIALAEKAGVPGSGYITARGDTFVHEFHPKEGEIAADIYAAGVLMGMVGPFVQYKRSDVRLGTDGSVGLMIWDSPKQEAVQVVVVSPDGEVTIWAECGKDAGSPWPVAGGQGVLMRVTGRQEPPVRYKYLQAGGEWVSFDVGPNARPMARVSGGSTVLFATSIGEKERFQLVDCAQGKVVWDIPSPVRHYEGNLSVAVAVDDKFLVVGQDFAAVDVKSGEVIASWQPNVKRSDMGRIVRRGGRLFVVTRERFVEIDPADITAKRNGWH